MPLLGLPGGMHPSRCDDRHPSLLRFQPAVPGLLELRAASEHPRQSRDDDSGMNAVGVEEDMRGAGVRAREADFNDSGGCDDKHDIGVRAGTPPEGA
eukprot:3860421-Pyramimonas_sp.AAC.1